MAPKVPSSKNSSGKSFVGEDGRNTIQYSVLVLDMQGKTHADTDLIARELEAQYGVGVFIGIEYQQHLEFFVVR
jgi:hypothetical protein